MRIRSQRVFCFVVALLAGVAGKTLMAQSGFTESAGRRPASGTGEGRLLNSNHLAGSVGSFPVMGLSRYGEMNTEQIKGEKGPFFNDKSELFPVFTSFSPKNKLSYIIRDEGYSGPIAIVTREFIPVNNYYLQSGFFCKREWEMERRTHIPFRFRLGSLAACNALEGKP